MSALLATECRRDIDADTRRYLQSPGFVPLAELERRAVVQAVREAGGNRVAAARLLGIGKTTLYRKMKEYSGMSLPKD